MAAAPLEAADFSSHRYNSGAFEHDRARNSQYQLKSAFDRTESSRDFRCDRISAQDRPQLFISVDLLIAPLFPYLDLRLKSSMRHIAKPLSTTS